MHHLVDHGSDGLVVCGTTGEAATLNDEEHLRMIELAATEMRGTLHDRRRRRAPTTRATRSCSTSGPRRSGSTACCRSTRTTTAPAAAGSSPTTARWSGPPTCRSCSTTSPSAPARTCPTTCWPSWRRWTTSPASSRPTHANLAHVDGLVIYAGNDDMLVDVLDMGEAGGILDLQPHVRRRDAPHGRRARAPARDRRRHAGRLPGHGDRPAGLQQQGGAEHDRDPGRRAPAPYVELDADEQAVVRAMLERHGMLAAA